jgi:hypothetical protein
LRYRKCLGTIHPMEPDEYVHLAEIGRRVGKSPEWIRQLAASDRDFPPAASFHVGRSRVWAWSAVKRYWDQRSAPVDPGPPPKEP